MANGDIIQETKEALASGDVSTKQALHYSLTIQIQQYERQKAFEERVTTVIEQHEKRITELDRLSVLKIWARHPKLVWAGLIGFMLLSTYVDVKALVVGVLAFVKP